MTRRFLDTNVIVRHLVFHPAHSHAATKLLERVYYGREKVTTAMTVVFETVFTLEHHYKMPRNEIRMHLLHLLAMPGVHLPGKRVLTDVFDLYRDPKLSFADAYHAVLARRDAGGEILSFDKGFDGVTRLDPVDLVKTRKAA